MNARAESPCRRLYDAHLHLQDPRLAGLTCGQTSGIPGEGADFIAGQVSNGTCPADWPLVQGLPGTTVYRAYGVHPWRVAGLPDDWEAQLASYLASGAVSVGEIGLDRWIEPRNEDLQLDVFEKQLALAAKLRLPPTLHCVRAWGMLVDCLRGVDLPRGFLVHGFGGSKETLYQLLDLGGFVSFSAYIANPQKHRIREAARACPADRLLVETDAPDMVPPAGICRYDMADQHGRLHHPLEITTAYACLAEIRNQSLDDLAKTVAENFHALFAVPDP